MSESPAEFVQAKPWSTSAHRGDDRHSQGPGHSASPTPRGACGRSWAVAEGGVSRDRRGVRASHGMLSAREPARSVSQSSPSLPVLTCGAGAAGAPGTQGGSRRSGPAVCMGYRPDRKSASAGRSDSPGSALLSARKTASRWGAQGLGQTGPGGRAPPSRSEAPPWPHGLSGCVGVSPGLGLHL